MHWRSKSLPIIVFGLLRCAVAHRMVAASLHAPFRDDSMASPQEQQANTSQPQPPPLSSSQNETT